VEGEIPPEERVAIRESPPPAVEDRKIEPVSPIFGSHVIPPKAWVLDPARSNVLGGELRRDRLIEHDAAAGERESGAAAREMPLEKTMVQDAVTVDEDEVRCRGLCDRLIHDDGLTKAMVLVPDLTDPLRARGFSSPNHPHA